MINGAKTSRPTTTLIITDSWDTTSDLVIGRLNGDVFRINTDLIRDFKILISKELFIITDPIGRCVRSDQISSVYWRKPFSLEAYNRPDHPEAYFFAECRYAIREIYNICRANGANALVEEGAERRLGKLRQMTIADRYFTVPSWRVLLGFDEETLESEIVKSLSGEPVTTDLALYASHVGEQTLDKNYLWFIQNKIEKRSDITVVYVDGNIFSFECTRFAQTVDWREHISEMESSDWVHVSSHNVFEEKLRGFMRECNLRFGRLDFVSSQDRLYFLEVNPNGQWAWLDLSNKFGLISAIALGVQA